MASLAHFIRNNLERILADWEVFARSLPPGKGMTRLALRDDAERVLRFIAEDMGTFQNRVQQQTKSEGRGPGLQDGGESAAHDHGVARLGDGFNLNEVVAEYRALRASVVRLWALDAGENRDGTLEELIRFNEAIDQALAESVLRFTADLDTSRDLFLAVLGHDLRAPLNAALLSAESIGRRAREAHQDTQTSDRLTRSLQRAVDIVGNLRDFTRGRLGVPLPVNPSRANIGVIFQQALEEVRAAHPDRTFVTEMRGDLDGEWDALRLSQLASNLIANAVQHGDRVGPIHIRLDAADDGVHAEVQNTGAGITESQARRIFDPLVRGATEDTQSMGLGLYIARQIALAHGGTIGLDLHARSGCTTFRVALPRRRPPPGARA